MTQQVALSLMIGYRGHRGKLYFAARLRQGRYTVTAAQWYTLLYLARLQDMQSRLIKNLENEVARS